VIKERFPKIPAWSIENVSVRNLVRGGSDNNYSSFPNVWMYEITFAPSDEQLRRKLRGTSDEQEFTQVVLFDGTVVTPTIK
jgi:hypothetical protein